jgi:hypothetical protein
MISFCQTIPVRDFNNLWQLNLVCNDCFVLQETWIGTNPFWILTVDDPLSAVVHFQAVQFVVILVDFHPEIHHQLGGEFAILALTSEIIHCRGFIRYSNNNPELENVYIDPKIR